MERRRQHTLCQHRRWPGSQGNYGVQMRVTSSAPLWVAPLFHSSGPKGPPGGDGRKGAGAPELAVTPERTRSVVTHGRARSVGVCAARLPACPPGSRTLCCLDEQGPPWVLTSCPCSRGPRRGVGAAGARPSVRHGLRSKECASAGPRQGRSRAGGPARADEPLEAWGLTPLGLDAPGPPTAPPDGGADVLCERL